MNVAGGSNQNSIKIWPPSTQISGIEGWLSIFFFWDFKILIYINQII